MGERRCFAVKWFKTIGLILILLIIISIPLTSCANTEENGVSTSPPPGIPEPGFDTDVVDSKSDGLLPEVGQEQLIVRNGDIQLVVVNVTTAGEEIENLVKGFSGFIVSSRFWNDGHDLIGYYSIRVPDESFEATMAALGNLAVEVKSESTDSYDVTQEYIDLDARLGNAEATENQYLVLLEKAVSVQDTLQIYESLSRVRAEIEQLKGRMLYLERITSTSLINIYLEPEKSSEPLVIGDWSITDAFKSVLRGVVTFGQWSVTGLMWLVVFSPIWGGVLAWIIVRRRRRQRAD
jgi:hypothetical protein